MIKFWERTARRVGITGRNSKRMYVLMTGINLIENEGVQYFHPWRGKSMINIFSTEERIRIKIKTLKLVSMSGLLRSV